VKIRAEGGNAFAAAVDTEINGGNAVVLSIDAVIDGGAALDEFYADKWYNYRKEYRRLKRMYRNNYVSNYSMQAYADFMSYDVQGISTEWRHYLRKNAKKNIRRKLGN
jgi:hypothetical protein